MSRGASTIGVLALQGDVREHASILASLGQRVALVRSAEDLAGVDALVVPGGESTTMSRLALLFGLTEPVRARIRDGMPAFGTCAGMIMLADEVLDGRADQESFGGLDISVRRNAFGRQVDSFEQEVAIEGLPGGLVHAVFIRAPWVERAAESVRVIGRVWHDDPGHAAVADRIVAVRTDRLLATSFHPELTGDARMHELFVEMVQEAL